MIIQNAEIDVSCPFCCDTNDPSYVHGCKMCRNTGRLHLNADISINLTANNILSNLVCELTLNADALEFLTKKIMEERAAQLMKKLP